MKKLFKTDGTGACGKTKILYLRQHFSKAKFCIRKKFFNFPGVHYVLKLVTLPTYLGKVQQIKIETVYGIFKNLNFHKQFSVRKFFFRKIFLNVFNF